MTMVEIREKAKGMGIKKAVGIKKADLIREIQAKEGNFTCFGTAKSFCDQRGCCFMEDCIQV